MGGKEQKAAKCQQQQVEDNSKAATAKQPDTAVYWPKLEVGSAKKSVKAEDFKIVEPDFRWSPPATNNASETGNGNNNNDISNEIACGVFVVLDGHGGPQAGSMCKTEFIIQFRACLDALVLVQPLVDNTIDQGNITDANESFLRPVDCWWRAYLPEALKQTFVELDDKCCTQFAHSGSTASAVVITRQSVKQKRKNPEDARPGFVVQVTAANVGDSHIYVEYEESVVAKGASARRSRMQMLNEDHRVQTNKREQQRILAQGGAISHDGRDLAKQPNATTNKSSNDTETTHEEMAAVADEAKTKAVEAEAPMRMWPGGLMMSRTLGDRDAVFSSAEPCIKQCVLLVSPDTCGGGCGRVIIASDGLWDELSPKTVASESKTKRAQAAAHHLTHMAAKRAGSDRDDITVIVVDLLPFSDMKLPFDNAFANNPKRSRTFSRRQSLSVRQRALSHVLPSVVVWEPELGQPSVWPESVVEWVHQSAGPAVSVQGEAVTLGTLIASTWVNVQLDEHSEQTQVMSVVAVDEERGCVLVAELQDEKGDASLKDVCNDTVWVFAEQCTMSTEQPEPSELRESADAASATSAAVDDAGVTAEEILFVEAIKHSVIEAGGSEEDVQRAMLEAIDNGEGVEGRGRCMSMDVAEAAAILRAQRRVSETVNDDEEWRTAPESNRTKAKRREEQEKRVKEKQEDRERNRAAQAAALTKKNELRRANKKKDADATKQQGGGNRNSYQQQSHQLYVGNLEFSVTKAMIVEHFGQFGKVSKCVIRKVGGTSNKQYAFVSFHGQSSDNSAANALAHARHEINGQVVKVKSATQKAPGVGGNNNNRSRGSGSFGSAGGNGASVTSSVNGDGKSQRNGNRRRCPASNRTEDTTANGEAKTASNNQQQNGQPRRQRYNNNQRNQRIGGKAVPQQGANGGAAVKSNSVAQPVAVASGV